MVVYQGTQTLPLLTASSSLQPFWLNARLSCCGRCHVRAGSCDTLISIIAKVQNVLTQMCFRTVMNSFKLGRIKVYDVCRESELCKWHLNLKGPLHCGRNPRWGGRGEPIATLYL